MEYITLCGSAKCCPVVGIPTKEGENYTIKDDYGGKIILTVEQFNRLKNIKTKRESLCKCNACNPAYVGI